jgi:predicted NAD-dependent protein-ADP-ribosyltransferase YbiA (DUF1768 family)
LQELNPKKNRAMGRKVKGFNAEAWDNGMDVLAMSITLH